MCLLKKCVKQVIKITIINGKERTRKKEKDHNITAPYLISTHYNVHPLGLYSATFIELRYMLHFRRNVSVLSYSLYDILSYAATLSNSVTRS